MEISIYCPQCDSGQIETFWDNIKIEMTVCVCHECSNSGTLNEFKYEVENETL
ncbi:MAG: hypothetical protein ACRCX2_19530 [Paraclostridium sp.]